jgi:hypothetical protein
MKEIPLTQGKVTLVDDEDYERLSQYKWFAQKAQYTFYAIRRKRVNGKWTHVRMHRIILGLIHGDGKDIDHRNRNGLDNQKNNLRLASPSLNGLNRKIHSNNTSGYRGVSYKSRDNIWVATIKFNKMMIYCGCFHDPITAAKAYDHASIEHWKENAILNFPLEVL